MPDIQPRIDSREIFIGLGANLDHPLYGVPVDTLRAALDDMEQLGISLLHRSSWYRSAPLPVSDQPWFVNSVAAVSFQGTAPDLLAALHKIEDQFGRVRQQRWEARVIDLDLLCFDGLITDNHDQQTGLVLPHPHLCRRAFVLEPLAQIAPQWRHPASGKSAADLLKMLPEAQKMEIMTG